ncbi:Replication protein O [Paraburkholderia fungorum]|uniref:Replication protein O n=1 Tax=Paraburkholderia fungorum TaxID=134537 RepID=UPI001C1EC884|nr:Replication protein O [Paraburkholderia fungorum]MBU7442663.1 Replication protein O [Paraburkholderia fungorum]
MLIAQPFVAGEGETRPEPADPANVVSDDDALADFTCDTTNLPWIIFRAAHRAAHLSGLPGRARALLAALARTVDAQRPYAAIFARRELLTGRAMQSMRTFYRGLDDLEAAGLIVRPPQNRYGEAGLFGRAYLHLTGQAAQLLGFVEPPAPPVSAEPAPRQSEGAQADSLTQRSASVADGAIYKDLLPGAFQKRQPGQLPVDLQRLRSLGFHEFLIFRLMKEARQHGKRLSDVVAVVWEHLKAAHRPINYLRKLLTTPTDFAHQRRARQAALAAAQQVQREAHEVQAVLSRCTGQTFFDATGTRRIVIAADVATTHDVREAQPRVMAGAWQAGFVDALHRGHLRPATAELDAQFAAQRREHQRARAPAAAPQGTAPARAPAAGLSRVGDTQLGILARLVGARRPTPDGAGRCAAAAPA